MRIDCPSCQAAYDVPDRLLSAGRTVRCARCGGEWTPHPETSPEHKGPNQEPQQAASRPAHELPPAPELPHPTAMERLAQQAPRLATPSSALRAAWAATFAMLALLFVAAYVVRSDVMQAWPPSIRLYSALGLAAH